MCVCVCVCVCVVFLLLFAQILPKPKDKPTLRAGMPIAERAMSAGVCAICNEQVREGGKKPNTKHQTV